MLPLLLVAVGAIAPPGAVRFDATVQGSALARTAHYDDGNELARIDSTLQPRLSVLRTGELQLGASYSPSLVVPWDLGSTETALSQNPAAEALSHHFMVGALYMPGRWQWHAVGNLTVGDAFFYGIAPTDPDRLRADPTGGGAGSESPQARQAVATTERIGQLSADVDVGTTGNLPAGTRLSLAVGASQSGATDEAAEDLLPTMRAVRARAGLLRRVAPRHDLGVALFGDRSWVDPDRDLAYLGAGVTWNHELGRRSALHLGTGLAWTWEREARTDAPSREETTPVLPWVEGSYSFSQSGQRPSWSAGVRVEPAVDRFRATLDLRGTAFGNVSWSPWRDWSLGLYGSTSLSVEPRVGWGDPHTAVHSLSAQVSRNFGPILYAGLSGGVVWQITDRTDLPGFREELVTLSLGARLLSL